MKNMKKLVLLIIGVCLLTSARAQTFTATATLTWTDSINPSGTTYYVYRAAGTCPSPLVWPASTFSIISGTTPITGLSYSDTTPLIAQTYCYTITSVVGGISSGPSPTAQAVITPAAPGSLTVTVVIK